MSAGSVIYNVRSIRVVDGEVTTSTLNGDRFGLMFAGVAYYEAYGSRNLFASRTYLCLFLPCPLKVFFCSIFLFQCTTVYSTQRIV